MIKPRKIKYLVSSNVNYYKKTLPKILPGLTRQVAIDDIIVTISGCSEKAEVSEIQTFCVPYNSYEYTSLVNLVDLEYQDCDYVFLLHDTMVCGDNFYRLSKGFREGDVVLAHTKGWCNLGIYRMRYLMSLKERLLQIKDITKRRAIEMEGKFFRPYTLFDNPVCELTKPRSENNNPYGDTKRCLCYFRAVDVWKYGANDVETFAANQIIDSL